MQYLQRRNNAVSGGVPVEADDVPGVLSTDLPLVLEKFLEHVAITDRGPQKRNVQHGQRLLHSEIGHQRADDSALEQTCRTPIGGNHVQELIAVINSPVGTNHYNAIAVTVEADSKIGAICPDSRDNLDNLEYENPSMP